MKLPKEMQIHLPPEMQARHWNEDYYGNQYIILDFKQSDGFWHGFIVNKRSGKSRNIARRKKRAVREILDRNYDKSQARFVLGHPKKFTDDEIEWALDVRERGRYGTLTINGSVVCNRHIRYYDKCVKCRNSRKENKNDQA